LTNARERPSRNCSVPQRHSGAATWRSCRKSRFDVRRVSLRKERCHAGVTGDYRPVVRVRKGPFSAAALVGANTVLLGWDVNASYDRSKLLGFAVRRTSYDRSTGSMLRSEWLEGQKRFKSVAGDYGLNVRSDQAPFQRFRWSDYTTKPECTYLYEIFPMTGTPGKLAKGEPLALKVCPTPYKEGQLGVYFNRGVTAAQAYLERFKDVKPSDVPDGAAYRWLSRGLKESLVDFIRRALTGDELHVAIFEFHDAEVASELSAAAIRGVRVAIVYHAPKATDSSVRESVKTLKAAGLEKAATPRKHTEQYSHNKFAVHLKKGKPASLWTGSANFTEAGFYLQTNCGIVADHPKTAEAYERYFQVLAKDPSAGKKGEKGATQDMVEVAISQAEAALKHDPWDVYFSPVRRAHIVTTAGEVVTGAKSAIFMSTPFAMDKRIVDAVLSNDDGILEYGLANTTARKKIEPLQRKNTRFFVPSRLETYLGRKWDAPAFGAHKIHAKFIVADPWGPKPVVFLGSANFSADSCRNNDENALLAAGNTRLAAMVACEFIRMFDHYKSRDFINKFYSDEKQEDRYLAEDGSWSRVYFDAKSQSHKYRDREIFAGKT